MSEIINNSEQKREMLKHLILQLHNNEAPEAVKKRLVELLHSVPYNDVIQVEQELISEGLPQEEVLRLCDIHALVLDGNIDHTGAKKAPPGHPVDTFLKENVELKKLTEKINKLFETQPDNIDKYVLELKTAFNMLSDVDKHYMRKEYLLFPFLEKYGITGPSTVMWGKHDETRAFLATAHEALKAKIEPADLPQLIEKLRPAVNAVDSMIMKEEEILLPMSMDTLKDAEWYQIYMETPQFGFCLYDPVDVWAPDATTVSQPEYTAGSAIRLSSGSFKPEELEALFSTLPVDITFVDKDDKVRFFSHSPNRVFERNRSILGRDVRLCHPPASVDVVERILEDFKSGKENRATFWISSFKGRFIHIDYTALIGPDGEYLGVLEVTQDITDLRKLEGDRRLLEY